MGKNDTVQASHHIRHTMSEWILLDNIAVRQANIWSIQVYMSPISGLVYHVKMTNGDKHIIEESQAGGKWLYLRVKEATEAGWTAKQVCDDDEEVA